MVAYLALSEFHSREVVCSAPWAR